MAEAAAAIQVCSVATCALLVLLASCCARTLGADAANSTAGAYLAPHNAARAQVGVPALVWDAGLAAYATRYAQAQAIGPAGTCVALRPSNGPYGENKFWGSAGHAWAPADAVASWVALRSAYNVSSNTCAPGRPCGEYTQVVWRNTVSLGCASAICSDNSTLIICSYNPPGNIVGQRPF